MNSTQNWYQKPTAIFILIILFFPVGLYLMWKNEIWSKNVRWIVTILLALIIFGNINSKSTEDCMNDKRAYEFGREMHTWVELRSAGLSLEDAIDEYSSGLGINPPYGADNGCVQRGFEDADSGKESSYNPDGKSWTKF